jgi:hypothetical protein
MKTKTTTEYDTFEHTMRELMKVPHSAIKSKLEEEKKAKAEKKEARTKWKKESKS